MDFFYSWECVSLSRSKATLDLVIKDRYDLMDLIHVVHHLT